MTMAPSGSLPLVLGLLVWLVEAAAGPFAVGAGPTIADDSSKTALAQCNLAATGTACGPFFLQTSATLGKVAPQEAGPLVQHVLIGPAQHQEATRKPVSVSHNSSIPAAVALAASQGKHAKPRFIGRLFDFEDWGWFILLLPLIALTIIGALMCREILDENQKQGQVEHPSRTLSEILRNGPPSFGTIQCLFLCFSCGVVMHATVAIPESRPLTSDLGYDATWAPYLIGAAWPLGCLSAPLVWYALTMPWSQASLKILVLVDCAILAVSALTYGLAAAPPTSWSWIAGWSVRGRTLMMLTSRAGIGLAWGTGGPCLRMIAQRVSPTDELLRLNVWFSFFEALGTGIGPFLSSLVCTLFGLQDAAGVRAAAPLYFVAGFWAVMTVGIFVLLPSNLEELLSTKQELDTAAAVPSIAINGMLQGECREAGIPWKKRLWLLALAACLHRVVMLSALEAASALALKEEFQWGRRAIGLAIGASFLIGVPSLAAIETMRRKAGASDTNALLGLAVSCLAATLLLSPGLHGGPLLFLCADAVIFPASFLVNGVADGLALQYHIPGTWLSPESMAVARIAFVGMLGTPLGPWGARALIAREGRGAYEGAQLVLVMLLLLGSLEARRVLAKMKNGD